MARITGPGGDKMACRFARGSRAVMTHLALPLQNALVVELCWLPRRRSMATVTTHSGLRVLRWSSLRQLTVVAGLALPRHYRSMVERRCLALNPQTLQYSGRRHPLIHRIAGATHDWTYPGFIAEFGVNLLVAGNAILARFTPLVSYSLCHQAGHSVPDVAALMARHAG